MAGANISENDSVPYLATARAQVSTTAGTHAGRYPSPGIKSISFDWHHSVVNFLGDHHIPLRDTTFFCFAS